MDGVGGRDVVVEDFDEVGMGGRGIPVEFPGIELEAAKEMDAVSCVAVIELGTFVSGSVGRSCVAVIELGTPMSGSVGSV